MGSPGNYQVFDVLMLVANLAPVALYFMVLGLVNSHSRPYLISSRSDFVLLTVVLAPVLMWPLPVLASGGAWWALVVGLGLLVLLFARLKPAAGSGYVLYNICEGRTVRLLNDALRQLGMLGQWNGSAWRSDDGRFSLSLTKLALLRNVTVQIDAPRAERRAFSAALGAALERRLDGCAQLPSAMGACLVLIGVCVMIVPMWMVGRHIHDLVDAMWTIFG